MTEITMFTLSKKKKSRGLHHYRLENLKYHTNQTSNQSQTNWPKSSN